MIQRYPNPPKIQYVTEEYPFPLEQFENNSIYSRLTHTMPEYNLNVEHTRIHSEYTKAHLGYSLCILKYTLIVV